MLTNATWLHMMLAYWNDDVVDVDELATAVNLAASISQDADALRELLALRREALVRGGAR